VKVLCVFGTRPEAIKMAPVVRELRRHPGRAEVRVCVTAQHREMLDQVLSLFEIAPDHDLGIMRPDQSLTRLTAAALTALDAVVVEERPDWVVVQGDTTTAMVAALVAFYHRVRVAHVEAGLRSWNRFQPFPEEVNRRLADALADLHFAPTGRARENLLREGVGEASIRVTGNTVIDALQWVAGLRPPPDLDAIAPAGGARLVLVTAHRRESFGAGLEAICLALRDLALRYGPALRIVYPVHLNPHVQEPVRRLLGELPNVLLLPPLDYLRLVHLMKRAHLILTDSGGIQEEAPGLGKPVLVLRDVTERPEAVEAGTARVVGTGRDRVVAETVRLLEQPAEYERMARAVNPFGDGHAAERIVETLLSATGGSREAEEARPDDREDPRGPRP
jgi:UDP-N-acetylglucosamine 2-epimerase (non-hydrolysing)